MPADLHNPHFQDAVRESFARQKWMHVLGAELLRIAPGEVDLSLNWRDDFSQQGGVLHAGVLASIADSACGYAALTLMPPGSDVVSVEFKLNLTAPARGTEFIARGRVLRAGKTLFTTMADVFAGEVLVATMLGTMMRRSG